jgi:hypothetical protein
MAIATSTAVDKRITTQSTIQKGPLSEGSALPRIASVCSARAAALDDLAVFTGLAGAATVRADVETDLDFDGFLAELGVFVGVVGLSFWRFRALAGRPSAARAASANSNAV